MDLASQFALIRGQKVTAWNMLDGRVMTGVLVRENFNTFTAVPLSVGHNVADFAKVATLMGISLDVASF